MRGMFVSLRVGWTWIAVTVVRSIVMPKHRSVHDL
jgi:hypothetical protein